MRYLFFSLCFLWSMQQGYSQNTFKGQRLLLGLEGNFSYITTPNYVLGDGVRATGSTNAIAANAQLQAQFLLGRSLGAHLRLGLGQMQERSIFINPAVIEDYAADYDIRGQHLSLGLHWYPAKLNFAPFGFFFNFGAELGQVNATVIPGTSLSIFEIAAFDEVQTAYVLPYIGLGARFHLSDKLSFHWRAEVLDRSLLTLYMPTWDTFGGRTAAASHGLNDMNKALQGKMIEHYTEARLIYLAIGLNYCVW